MKMLIALDNNKGLDSMLSKHFGHCSFFAIYDFMSKKIEYVSNNIDHKNSLLSPVDQVLKHNIDVLFTLGVGKRAINLFSEKNIQIKTGNYTKLYEVIKNIDNLETLSEGCNH
jgi:predicted Fe-Mo cluster-binding NifX family protein